MGVKMTQQNEAFLDAKTPFDGPAYDHERDWERLNRQMRAIYTIMKDGQWRTLQDLEDLTGYPQASISAQLRAFRRPKFGGHTVEREYVRNGLHKYRLLLSACSDTAAKQQTTTNKQQPTNNQQPTTNNNQQQKLWKEDYCGYHY